MFPTGAAESTKLCTDAWRCEIKLMEVEGRRSCLRFLHVLGTEPMTLWILGKHSTAEIHPQSSV